MHNDQKGKNMNADQREMEWTGLIESNGIDWWTPRQIRRVKDFWKVAATIANDATWIGRGCFTLKDNQGCKSICTMELTGSLTVQDGCLDQRFRFKTLKDFDRYIKAIMGD